MPRGLYGTVYRGDPGTVCDVQIRKLQKGTSCAADCRNTESQPGLTFDTDCHNTLKARRADDLKSLSQILTEGE